MLVIVGFRFLDLSYLSLLEQRDYVEIYRTKAKKTLMIKPKSCLNHDQNHQVAIDMYRRIEQEIEY